MEVVKGGGIEQRVTENPVVGSMYCFKLLKLYCYNFYLINLYIHYSIKLSIVEIKNYIS